MLMAALTPCQAAEQGGQLQPLAPEFALPPGGEKALKMTILIRQLVLDKYDRSGTGVLSEEDKKLLVADARLAREEAKKAFVKRFDKDGDGKLNRDEMQAFREEVARRRGHGPGMGRGPRHGHGMDKNPVQPPRMRPPHATPSHEAPPKMVEFKTPGQKKFHVAPGLFLLTRNLLMAKYDSDGDGRVSQQEHQQVLKDAEALYLAKVAELMELYDLDKDGRLSPIEREQALAAGQKDAPRMGDEAPDEIDLFIRANIGEVLLHEAPLDEAQSDAAGAEPAPAEVNE